MVNSTASVRRVGQSPTAKFMRGVLENDRLKLRKIRDRKMQEDSAWTSPSTVVAVDISLFIFIDRNDQS